MQMVKIRIPSQDDRSKSFVELARRGRVICLLDNEFVVPEPALKLLASLDVAYDELGAGRIRLCGKDASLKRGLCTAFAVRAAAKAMMGTITSGV